MGKTHNKPGSRKNNNNYTPSQQSKRLWMSNDGGSDTDADIVIDAVLGALADPITMDRFVSSLCAVPDVKAKLIEHLLPTLDKRHTRTS